MTADSAPDESGAADTASGDSSTAIGDSTAAPDDSTAATLGFVLAGLALAAAFLEWTPVVAMYGVPSLPGAIAAGVALVVLALRRHGALDRAASRLAILGFAGVLVSGAAALLLPVLSGGEAPATGSGVFLALFLGIVGVGVAYADSVGMRRDALVPRLRDCLVATGIGVGGLLFGFLVTIVFAGLLAPAVSETVAVYLQTVAFSIGLGIVAVGYALRQPEGLAYFDIRMLTRRDWLYTAGGIVGMFVLLIAGGVAVSVLGLPSSEHGFIEQARQTPAILLPLIPLSYLAIGPGEELLNRNVVQKLLYTSYSQTGAILVATLIFTVIHIPAYAGAAGPGALLVTLVRLFSVSLVLGVVYERTENVVAAAIVHGSFDAIQFGAAYLLITAGLY